MNNKNSDLRTIESFGSEWNYFDQSSLDERELNKIFDDYFNIFPWSKLNDQSIGFDMGCGSGRWANLVATKVGKLYCIDPSDALEVAKENLKKHTNIIYSKSTVEDMPFEDNSFDFGYSLGVLHHLPDTSSALNICVSKLKIGAPLLVYLYYNFDNKSKLFKAIWFASEFLRRVICLMPNRIKLLLTDIIAFLIYFPLAKSSRICEILGLNVEMIPLSYYRNLSFYTMRTDSRDRFGTPLEKRFSRSEILLMLQKAGLDNIIFSSRAPFWCAVGIRKI